MTQNVVFGEGMLLSPVKGGEASYAVLARVLSAMYSPGRQIDRRQVATWHQRHTVNKKGEPFPEPVRVNQDAKRGQPKNLFDVPAVVAWYSAGIPCRGSNQHEQKWKGPGQ
jgi:hypothetical protein